jgi:hypothetical protein
MRLLRLSLAVLGLLLAASSASPAPPIAIVAVATPRIAVTGGDTVTVHLSRRPADSSVVPLCRIDPAVGGTTHLINATTPTFPGKWLEPPSSIVTCENAPRVAAEGPGVVVVSLDGGTTWLKAADPDSDKSAPSDAITYYRRFDAALDRRPYVAEEVGHLLVMSEPSLAGQNLSVTASLPATGHHWAWEGVPGGVEHTLPFNLTVSPQIHLYSV